MLALMSVFFYLGMEMHLCYLDPLYLAFWNRHGHKHKYWGFFSPAEWAVRKKKKAKKLYVFAKAENQPKGFRSRLQHPCEKGIGVDKKVAFALWKDSLGD